MHNRKYGFCVLGGALVATALYACSSTNNTTPPPVNDAGTSSSGSSSGDYDQQ